MRVSLPDVPIQLFYSKNNEHFVREVVKPLAFPTWLENERSGISASHSSDGTQLLSQDSEVSAQKEFGTTTSGWPALTLEPLPGDNFQKLNYSGYSVMLESPEFWDSLLGDKVLVFEGDSWVCKDAPVKLQQWLQYDYVGAPWNHYVKGCPGGVGNGGFSLRNRQMFQDIAAAAQVRSEEERKKEVQPGEGPAGAEDIFFCKELQRLKERKDEGASFMWHIPADRVQGALWGDSLESESFSLVGLSGRFRIRFWPQGQKKTKNGFCAAEVVAEEDTPLVQMKLAVGDEERLLSDDGPVEFKAGGAHGYRDFSKAPNQSVALRLVLVDEDLGPKLPYRSSADTFAEEERVDLERGNPLGVHRPWDYEAQWYDLKGSCPGLHLLHKAWHHNIMGPTTYCPASAPLARGYLKEYRQFLSTMQLSSAPQFWKPSARLWLLLAALIFSQGVESVRN